MVKTTTKSKKTTKKRRRSTFATRKTLLKRAARRMLADGRWPTAPEPSCNNDIGTYGYVVLRGVLQPTASFVERMRVVASKATSIFNHNGTAPDNDHLRTQAYVSTPSDYDIGGVDALFSRRDLFASELRRSPFVALHAAPGCQAQHAHADYPPTGDAARARGVLLALEPQTTLDVWPRSCHLDLELQDSATVVRGIRDGSSVADFPCAFPLRRHQVHLSAGDVVVFRGDLVHAGSAYARSNVRMHCYMDAPGVARPENKTWYIQGATRYVADV